MFEKMEFSCSVDRYYSMHSSLMFCQIGVRAHGGLVDNLVRRCTGVSPAKGAISDCKTLACFRWYCFTSESGTANMLNVSSATIHVARTSGISNGGFMLASKANSTISSNI
jgi:hypothetical protein